MTPGALTVPEAAELLGISIRTMHRLVRAGVVPRKRMKRTLRVPRAYLDGFLASDAETLEQYAAEQTRALDSVGQ